jgi:hypothetical protein
MDTRTVEVTSDQAEALMATVQDAQDAALGDSNDEEIDLLRDALDHALSLLGLTLPPPKEDDE